MSKTPSSPDRHSAATAHTLRFVEKHGTPGRFLEVGCGRGALAAAIQASGSQVMAIDADPRAVEATKAKGVDARNLDVLELDAGPFDTILFSRCLHHVSDPASALRRAAGCLSPRGSILIEDFGYDLIDAEGARWRYRTATAEPAVEALTSSTQTPTEGAPRGHDWMARWRREHPAHHLHDSAALSQAVGEALGAARHRRGAYLYRYAIDEMGSSRQDLAAGEACFRSECEQIRARQLAPIGLRWIYHAGADQKPTGGLSSRSTEKQGATR